MHILIATDGQLDTTATTEIVARLHRPDDAVTVLTVLDHPTRFLRGYAEAAGVSEVATIAREAGAGVIGFASGAKAAERLAPILHHEQAEERPTELDQYFRKRTRSRVDILVEHLEEAGIDAEAAWTTTDNQTARSILDFAERAKADLLVVGSHGNRRLNSVLGSTATKILRHASIPVVVIP